MKIKKFKSKQLLKLHLLKSRVYEYPIKKITSNNLVSTNIDQLLVDIKKALQIIFQYDQIEKRILFIGLPSKLELKINLLTRHSAVFNKFNVQGFLSNNNIKFLKDIQNSSQYWTKKYSKLLLPKLTKKPDLIVLFDHEKYNSILSEAWVLKIPVIAFNTNNDATKPFFNNFYVIKGNFRNMLITPDKNIFFIGLNFLFKNLKKKKVESSLMFSKPNSQLSFKHRKGLKHKTK